MVLVNIGCRSNNRSGPQQPNPLFNKSQRCAAGSPLHAGNLVVQTRLLGYCSHSTYQPSQELISISKSPKLVAFTSKPSCKRQHSCRLMQKPACYHLSAMPHSTPAHPRTFCCGSAIGPLIEHAHHSGSVRGSLKAIPTTADSCTVKEISSFMHIRLQS